MRIGDHGIADIRRIARDDRQHLGRQARLVERVGQEQRGQRRELGRLQHDAVVGGEGRCKLVRHHVERMIERRDRRDRVQGLAQGEDLAWLAVRGEVAGEGLAVVEQAELAGEGEDVVGTADLVERVLQAETRLQRDQARQLFLARDQQLGRPEQDLLALVARQLRLVVVRDPERLGHQFRRGARHGADEAVVPREPHFETRSRIDLLAGDAQCFVARLGADHRIHQAASLGDEVEGEIEGVEVAPMAAVGRRREPAIADQRHVLLGDAAMAAQRFRQAGKIVARR